MKKNQEKVLKLAVKRMLPGGVLGKKQLTKLKNLYWEMIILMEFNNPTIIDLGKLNNKNLIRN